MKLSGGPRSPLVTLYRRKRPYGFIIEKNNNMGSKTVPMGSKSPEPTLELSQFHGKPWYPVSRIFLSCKTVEFYSKPYGILPQDFNLGQIYCHFSMDEPIGSFSPVQGVGVPSCFNFGISRNNYHAG